MNDIYKALADPNRRRILELLSDRDMTAGEIAERFDLARSTLSGHFGHIQTGGFNSCRQKRYDYAHSAIVFSAA